MPFPPEVLVSAVLSIFLFLALCGVLVLIVVSMRTPTTMPLAVATGLLVLALAVVAVVPANVPTIMGVILALLAIPVGALGGNPMTRRVLELATRGRVRETEDGGILVGVRAERDPSENPDAASDESGAILRGGRTIGYLERLGAVVAIVAGYPEALAVIVAIKGIGRFSELAAAEARERFIIGTLVSLLWACVVGALVRLAVF